MRMKLFIEKIGEEKEISYSGNGKDLCKLLGIPIDTVIIVRNNSIVTEDIMLEDTDNIQLLSVISGG